METDVYAVVNRENGLPVLVFTQTLPNFEEPPSKRGGTSVDGTLASIVA